MGKYSSGWRGGPAKAVGRFLPARGFKSLLLRFIFLLRPLGQVVKTSPFHGGITGSNPVGVIQMWRITQVRLKGTVLKTVRCVKARKGSNPLSSLLYGPVV